MRNIAIISILLSISLCVLPAFGQDAPKFYQDTYPKHALDAAVTAKKALMGKDAELDVKTRELIALGVAAQVPCSYCVYYHQKSARSAGASEGEIREAVAIAAHVRHWSTVLNGMGYDFELFKSEIDKTFE